MGAAAALCALFSSGPPAHRGVCVQRSHSAAPGAVVSGVHFAPTELRAAEGGSRRGERVTEETGVSCAGKEPLTRGAAAKQAQQHRNTCAILVVGCVRTRSAPSISSSAVATSRIVDARCVSSSHSCSRTKGTKGEGRRRKEAEGACEQPAALNKR